MIGSIRKMKTLTTWFYNTNSIRAKVALALFTAVDPDHANSGGDYKLMV